MRRFKESWTGIDKQALLYTFCCHEHIGWLHIILISSVQFCCSVMANSLQPHGLHYSRLSCPSPTPGARSNSCPSSQSMMPSNHFILCHPLLLLLSIFLSIRSFQMSQFFTSGGQSIGVSALAWILPMNIQDWFPLRLVWSPCSPRDSQESSPTSQFKSINFLVPSFLYSPVLIILFLFIWLILQHQKCRQGLSIVMKKLAPGIHSN